jgi:hypothetical protein
MLNDKPMRAKMESDKSNEKYLGLFCTLEYRPQDRDTASTQGTTIAMLVFRPTDNNLQLLVHPKFRTIVQEEDLVYIETLLMDLFERAERGAATLFKQISSLGVGPLVTQEVGTSLLESPSVQKIYSQFIEYKIS